VCGLKLYEDVDEDVFAGLISSIKRAQQDYGSLVKLSFGGSAYGNLKVHTKVKKLIPSEKFVLSMYHVCPYPKTQRRINFP
jgi:hypothetical protein